MACTRGRTARAWKTNQAVYKIAKPVPTMKITHLYINLHPGSWKLMPWISTLKPTESGQAYYAGGWQFDWLCFRLQRHTLKTL
jgi:hypothetical protein